MRFPSPPATFIPPATVTGGRHNGCVTRGTSLRFAAVARTIGDACRSLGLVVPAYRSPPRIRGDRSIRRRAGDGGATVAVRYRDRPWPAVVADMVEGVVVTNRLEGSEADRVRTALWTALEDAGDDGDAGRALRAVA